MVEAIVKFLMNANLLNTRSTFILGFIGILIVFCVITSIVKRAVHFIIMSLLALVLFSGVFFAKINIVDKNNLEFTTQYVKHGSEMMQCSSISNVTVSSNKKNITIYDKDGNSMNLTVGTNYSEPIKKALDTIIKTKGM